MYIDFNQQIPPPFEEKIMNLLLENYDGEPWLKQVGQLSHDELTDLQCLLQKNLSALLEPDIGIRYVQIAIIAMMYLDFNQDLQPTEIKDQMRGLLQNLKNNSKSENIDIDSPLVFYNDYTLLEVAASIDSIHTVKYLLEKEGASNIKEIKGGYHANAELIMDISMYRAIEFDSKDVIHFLLTERKFDLAQDLYSISSHSKVHLQDNSSIVHTSRSETTLEVAFYLNNIAFMEYILGCGVPVNAGILYDAVKKSRDDVLALLLKYKQNGEIEFELLIHLLVIAVECGNTTMVESMFNNNPILSRRDQPEVRDLLAQLLYRVVDKFYEELILLLFNRGADVKHPLDKILCWSEESDQFSLEKARFSTVFDLAAYKFDSCWLYEQPSVESYCGMWQATKSVESSNEENEVGCRM